MRTVRMVMAYPVTGVTKPNRKPRNYTVMEETDVQVSDLRSDGRMVEIAGVDWVVAGNRLYAPVRHQIEGRGIVRLRDVDDVNLATRRTVRATAMEGIGLPTGDFMSRRPFDEVIRLAVGQQLGDIFQSVVSDGRSEALERAGRGFAFVDGEFRTDRFEPVIDLQNGNVGLVDLETGVNVSLGLHPVGETWHVSHGTSTRIKLPLTRGPDRKGGLAALGIVGDITGVECRFDPREGLVRLAAWMVSDLRACVVDETVPWVDTARRVDSDGDADLAKADADDRAGVMAKVDQAFEGYARDPRLADLFIRTLSDVRGLFSIPPSHGIWDHGRHLAAWEGETVGEPEMSGPSEDLDDDRSPTPVPSIGRPSPAPGF